MKKRYTDYNTINISNDSKVNEYFDWRLDNYKFRRQLLNSNIPKYVKAFGKPTYHYRGEFYTSIWLIPYKGFNYFILSSKGKGSNFEIEVTDNFNNSPNIEFLDYILGKILSDVEYATYIF